MKPQWVLVGATILLSVLLLTVGRGSYEKGRVEVTVVPSDAQNLACEGSARELSCSAQRALQPFVTTSGRLVALPGLFEEPAVAEWLRHAKAPSERMRVRCHSRRVAMGVTLSIRFSLGDAFKPATLDVADIGECEVF